MAGATSSEKLSILSEYEPPGLSPVTASVFIVGFMAGSGVLALPYALQTTGPIGVLLLMVVVGVQAYTGCLLSQSWLLVQERHPHYRTHTRYPYPAIGQVTFGKPGRLFVSITLNMAMFGAVIVYLILAAENVEGLLHNLAHVQLKFCYILPLIAAVVCPLTWLGTPKDFWPVAVGSLLATAGACAILLVAMATDNTDKDSPKLRVHSDKGFLGLFSALGTMVFSAGPHPALPTVQADMKSPVLFTKAVLASFSIILLLYTAISLTGYLVYGPAVEDNILKSISPGPMVYTVQILVTLHLFCSMIVALNPVAQEVEELLGLKTTFSWHKVLVRTVIVGCVLFMAVTVPSFGVVLSLIGGSTLNILVIVCPSVFYLKLGAMKDDLPVLSLPLHTKVLLWEIAIVGCLVAVLCTYSAIDSLATPDSFTVPCYVR